LVPFGHFVFDNTVGASIVPRAHILDSFLCALTRKEHSRTRRTLTTPNTQAPIIRVNHNEHGIRDNLSDHPPRAVTNQLTHPRDRHVTALALAADSK
jgi:hypothetical protein